MSSGSRVECRQNRRRGKRLSSSGAWRSFNIKQGIQPSAALTHAAGLPVQPQPSGDAEPDIRLAGLPEAMLESDPNIAELLHDPIQPTQQIRPRPLLVRAQRQ